MVLEEFRKLQGFKELKPFVRKSTIGIGKHYTNSRFSIYKNKVSVNIPDLLGHVVLDKYESKTVKQDSKLFELLDKISQYGYCLSYGCKDDLYSLYKFTKVASKNKPEFIYHVSNVSPDIILKEGLKRHYSLDVCKAHPPLIFASRAPIWEGTYTYKIKNNYKLFIDTNLDWQRRDILGIYCIYDDIRKQDIEVM